MRDAGNFGIEANGQARIESCIVSGSADNGIILGADGHVADNLVVENGDIGIHLYSGTVQGNIVRGNTGSGIRIFDTGYVAENFVRQNGGAGLDVSASTGYRANVINGNGGVEVIGAISLGQNACGGDTNCP